MAAHAFKMATGMDLMTKEIDLRKGRTRNGNSRGEEDEMSKREEVEEYLRTHAVNCETEREAQTLLGFLDELGFRWNGGKSLKGETNWEDYKDETSYTYGFFLEGVSYARKFFYLSEDYNVVSFKTFKERFMKREFKPGDKVKLRDDLTVKEMNGQPGMVEDMWEVARAWQTLTIKKITLDRIDIEEDDGWYWNPDWFELVTPAEEYKEYTVEELEERLGEKIKIKGKVR